MTWLPKYSFVWCNITPGEPIYWWVLGLNTRTWRSKVIGPSAFYKARTVTVTFNVTVPATTDATGLSVHIAGELDSLDGNLPSWNPGATVLTRVDSTHWTITLTGKEGTEVEYKYTLGDWSHVEKDVACGEIVNHVVTLNYGTTGTQVVNDVAANWRNVAPCGD